MAPPGVGFGDGAKSRGGSSSRRQIPPWQCVGLTLCRSVALTVLPGSLLLITSQQVSIEQHHHPALTPVSAPTTSPLLARAHRAPCHTPRGQRVRTSWSLLKKLSSSTASERHHVDSSLRTPSTSRHREALHELHASRSLWAPQVSLCFVAHHELRELHELRAPS